MPDDVYFGCKQKPGERIRYNNTPRSLLCCFPCAGDRRFCVCIMDLEGLKEAMNREPKFHFGDKVSDKDTGETFTVAIVHFDPCDGWEYGPAQDGKFYRLYFEDDLYGA